MIQTGLDRVLADPHRLRGRKYDGQRNPRAGGSGRLGGCRVLRLRIGSIGKKKEHGVVGEHSADLRRALPASLDSRRSARPSRRNSRMNLVLPALNSGYDDALPCVDVRL